MTDRARSLFEAVREACSPAVWSRGVELTRAGAVIADRAEGDELLFRISTRGGMISIHVRLFPDDDDWDCECDARRGACEHVAAATIAWRRAADEGGALLSASEAGQVEYRFSRNSGRLALGRVIVRDGSEYPFTATLAALAAGRVEGPAFAASGQDLRVELALGTHRHGTLAPQLPERLFGAMADCPALRLDGRPVKVSPQPVHPSARVVDQDQGFRLFVEEDRSVTERFDNGVVLCGDTLRPIGESRLTGRELEQLPRGRYFGPDAVAELLSEVLPDLRRRIPVEIETERLPTTEQQPPRIHLDLERDRDVLSVLATLVYGDPPSARIDGGRLVHLKGPVPLRDVAAERRQVRRLRTELRLAPGVREQFQDEEAVAFTRRLESWRGKIGGKAHDYFRIAAPLEPRVHVDGERFAVEFTSAAPTGAAGAGRADPEAVVRAWKRGGSLVPLLEGGWAPLPVDWLERFGHRVADLLAAKQDDGALPRCCLPDVAALCEDLNEPPPPETAALKARLDDFDGIAPCELPADLRTSLRTYQRRGVDWLVFLRDAGMGALLADDMGLGKTVQALCAIRGRSLVVAPTSVLHNWADEIRRHRPGLSFSVYHGAARELDPQADVTLTTYALLRLDADRLAAVSWDTVVLDEAQAIKNPDSQVAAAAYRLEAGLKMTLTGTPVENRLDELWSQFHFINRGLLGGRKSFDERYAAPIAEGQPGAAQRLRERIRPFVLRRLKRDVAPELPPRTDLVLRCQLTPQEREVYDAIRAASLAEVVRRLEAGGSVLAALEVLLRLRQAACHTGLVPGQEAAGSSKIDVLLEALESVVAEGHKALVFSQWTSLLDLTEPHLRRAGIDFNRLDGSTRDRASVVGAFQNESGPPVMLVSLRAGGTGLNLTAADHVFLLDPWWNPAVEDQAADRTHRIGQDRPVMVYRLMAEDTVEERILELQQSKREIAAAALGEADRAASVTRAELLDLLH